MKQKHDFRLAVLLAVLTLSWLPAHPVLGAASNGTVQTATVVTAAEPKPIMATAKATPDAKLASTKTVAAPAKGKTAAAQANAAKVQIAQAVSKAKDLLTFREEMDKLRVLANKYYYSTGELQKGLELDKQCWYLCRKKLGEKDILTLKFMGNYAEFLQKVGDYGQALTVHKNTVRLCREVLGPNHEITLLNTHNLALNLALVGRYDEALELSEQTL